MIKIVKATIEDCPILVKLSKQTFLESHGNSASKKDVSSFITNTYNREAFNEEMQNSNNVYHILYFNNEIAGYSKIVLNTPNKNINEQNVTKLDRLYLLKKFYGKNLGVQFLGFNIEFSKKRQQKGVWLAVWVENFRAINFYKKMDFKIVGSFDFKISDTHSNPNHIMFLNY